MIPTKPNNVTWTDDQWKSIYAKGTDILVAAAAGSGKTAVLVERIIQRILKDGIDVDRLLVVTFTNLSAREMKHRVDQRIHDALREEPNNEHLKQQRIKINQAHISTLHRFCLDLIQQHYDVLNIDPNFRTSSEAENILLLEQTIDDVLEQYYDTLDDDFMALTEQLSSDRDDQTLRDTVKQLYYFSVAHPHPKQWLARLSEPYADTEAQEKLLKELVSLAKIFLTSAQQALDKSYEYFTLLEETEKQLDVIRDEQRFMATVMEDGYLNTEKIAAHQFVARFPSLTKKIKEANPTGIDLYQDAKDYYDAYKQHVEKVKTEYFSRSADALQQDMQQLAPRVSCLAAIARDVIDHFNAKKRERNILDFSDYEHFALQILMHEDGTPTDIADAYRQYFEEILVDEYQDTNRVQEQILSCIKRGDETNGNLFMVGDVKQSIYKFRQADPSLFIEKYNAFNRDGHDSGMRIDLSQNFRSRPEVLSTTNYLFNHMMDTHVGEITYDAAARLYHGAPYDAVQCPVDLKVLVQQPNPDMTGAEQEANYIVEQVQHIMQTGKVYDIKTDSYRPVTYKDIVILERGFSNATVMQQAFKDANIPFHVNSRAGYFEQTEVRLILSFLRVVDNPLQDIYLVGLMRSVIYQFNEAELAHIRVVRPDDDYFYESLQHYVQAQDVNTVLQEKIQRFLDDIARYQTFSAHNPVYALIDRFYNDRLVLQYFSGMVGGRSRQANLHGLFNKAVEFENSSYRGLYQFIRFIDELIERGKDFGEENIVGPNDDVVRMMTVHSSKGLEFPFVIYSGLSKRFNRQDLQRPVILNAHYGLGMDYYDVTQDVTFPSLASVTYRAIAEKELISEEMRLIYVALTRAREKLILIGRIKDEKTLDHLARTPITKGMLAVDFRRTVATPFDLMYAVLSKHQSTSIDKALQFETDITTLDASLQPYVHIHLAYQDDALDMLDDADEDKRDASQIDQYRGQDTALQQQIATQLTYDYPHREDTMKASKQSVSELKRQLESEEVGTDYERVRQYRLGAAAYERPQFLQRVTKRQANEIGTLMHTVMQHLPFNKNGMNRTDLDAYIETLVDRNLIDADAPQDIRKSEVLDFIQSPLYDRIAHSEAVYRELPFVVNQAQVDHLPEQETDASIIQGMIDLVFVENGTYYFVDYKTDAFHRRRGMTDEEIGAQLKEKYRVQMAYYQRTLETILKVPVYGYLYFFQYGVLSID